MSEFTKGISRAFIVLSFTIIVGLVLFFSYFGLVLMVGGSHGGGSNGFFETSMAIIISIDLIIIVTITLFFRFLWRKKIH